MLDRFTDNWLERLRLDAKGRAIAHLILVALIASWSIASYAVALYVAPHGSDENPGSDSQPLKSIQVALDRATAGDQILVIAGTYAGPLRTRAAGMETAPIVLKATEVGSVVITANGRTSLEISHPFYVVENLIFDGEFSKHDVIRVRSNGDGLVFRNNLVRNGAKDGIDLGNAATSVGEGFDYLENITIADSKFENFLAKDFFGNRIDAHGIVAGGVRNLTIEATTVEMVSGDALQLANGNWDEVTVRSVIFRNLPVTADIAAATGFDEGVNPGENAIDTKQDSSLQVRSRLTITQSVFSGWAGELISNAAALNLKEKVAVVVDRCVFFDNEIALRLRGAGQTPHGANVQLSNSVFYTNQRSIRVEDNLLDFQLIHNTFGINNGQNLQWVNGGAGDGFNAKNNAFLMAELPSGIPPANNLTLDSTDFVDLANADYRLIAGSDAIDTAVTLPEYGHDHGGRFRPQGVAADFGALEHIPTQQLSMVDWFDFIAVPALMLLARRSSSAQ